MTLATLSDILERLKCGPDTSTDFGLHLRKYQALCNEAADEIERLRGELSAAQGNADDNYKRLMAAREAGFKRAKEMAAKWLDGEAEAHGSDKQDASLALRLRFQQAAEAIRALTDDGATK